jgi:hypothetical protein
MSEINKTASNVASGLANMVISSGLEQVGTSSSHVEGAATLQDVRY